MAPSWWPLGKQSCVGIDLGSSAFKAVELAREDAGVVLRAATVAATPAGALTEGALTDGLAVAEGLKAMLSQGKIRTRNAAAGVGGDRVVCRSDRPRGSEIDAFVRAQAAGAVQYALDAACLGWQPVESMIEGSVMWTAAPVEQVDWVRATAGLAGRAPNLVTPQACAIANIYGHGYEPSGRNAVLILHIGARRMLAMAMRGWAVAHSCDVALGRQRSVEGAELDRRVLEMLEPHLDALTASVRPHELELVLLSGGGAGSESLRQALRERSGVDVDRLDPFRKIGYSPESEAGKAARQYGPAMAVAAGLALTGLGEA
ncbi:MAG: pilus assembly protein PilM [Bryobacterales bacterium]|nr:pilus assembly protein PilM [Acidobacteriota bacterium]MCB9384803.1 pilus assembly protein PilM [Bryobacterales bacterium]